MTVHNASLSSDWSNSVLRSKSLKGEVFETNNTQSILKLILALEYVDAVGILLHKNCLYSSLLQCQIKKIVNKKFEHHPTSKCRSLKRYRDVCIKQKGIMWKTKHDYNNAKDLLHT